ncbi:ATPase [Rhodobacteraceae bacterium]|nr:ATPase [Paracoccaceae bacterium]
MSDWAMKRFWEAVSFEATDDGYLIKLDNRPVKTPAKTLLIVPNEVIAAHIASEWEAQVETVDPLTMPWTRTANAAIDKVAVQRAGVIEHLSGYAGTDLLCYRAAGPDRLVQLQQQTWDPILEWLAVHLNVSLRSTVGVMPVDQAPSDIARLAKAMDPMTDFQLTGFHDLVGLSGSFVIGLAAAKNAFTIEELWAASCLDETWQIKQWGEDVEARANIALKKQAFLHATEVYRAG